MTSFLNLEVWTLQHHPLKNVDEQFKEEGGHVFRLTHLVLFDHCRVKMPNVCPDIKLDFKDVLLRPKRSKIRSRADVSMDIICQYNIT